MRNRRCLSVERVITVESIRRLQWRWSRYTTTSSTTSSNNTWCYFILKSILWVTYLWVSDTLSFNEHLMILASIVCPIRWSWWLQWWWRRLMITIGMALLELLWSLLILLLLFWLCCIRDRVSSIWSEDWSFTKESCWLVFLSDLRRRRCSELVIIGGCIRVGFLEHTELLILRDVSVSAAVRVFD